MINFFRRYLHYIMNSEISFRGQLVLLVGAKLQHVIATLALESAGISGYFVGAKLKPRDDLFWFKKPELLLSLIHFVLFQVSYVHRNYGFLKSCNYVSFSFNFLFPLKEFYYPVSAWLN